jgi:hypothetical protein
MATKRTPITRQLKVQVTQEAVAIYFDHLVGEQKERFRDREPKCFRGLEVDSQVELGRLLHGQVGGRRALQNLVHVAGSASEQIGQAPYDMSPPATTFSLTWYMPGSRFLARKSMIHPMWSWCRRSAVIVNASGRARIIAAKALSNSSELRIATNSISTPPRAAKRPPRCRVRQAIPAVRW